MLSTVSSHVPLDIMLLKRNVVNDQRSNCIPWLGYDGGAVLVQGAMGEPATDSYKVSSFLLESCIIKQTMCGQLL